MYKHTQFAKLSMAVLFGAAILITVLGSILGWNPVGMIVFVILIVCIPLFYCLTVVVNESYVEILFGIGLIKKRFMTKDIVQILTVRNSWLSGWGIRFLFNGTWLYNVSGLDVVEIVMSNGKRYRIGTDEPNELVKAIKDAIKI
jgi:uncharacterized membrane protein